MLTFLADTFVWDLDPVVLHSPVQIRYYGIVLACTLMGGYLLWRWQMRRGAFSLKTIDAFILWGVAAVFIGARLGHVFFYEWPRYSANPVSILYVWEGGLASHGATVGLVLALALFAWWHKLSLLATWDRFTFSAALGATGVRIGNFLNSEIVGRQTDLPWAVKFPLSVEDIGVAQGYFGTPDAERARELWQTLDAGTQQTLLQYVPARHPSQLYEVALGLFVMAVLLIADRLAGREKRPVGMLFGLFLTVYFAGRFCVEFVKEYQALDNSFLTMGQYLSIIPFSAGVILLTWSLIARRSTPPAPAIEVQLIEKEQKKAQEAAKGKKAKRK